MPTAMSRRESRRIAHGPSNRELVEHLTKTLDADRQASFPRPEGKPRRSLPRLPALAFLGGVTMAGMAPAQVGTGRAKGAWST